MKTADIIQKNQKFIMNTYGRLPVALVKGKGSYVWDAEGKKYLDFFSGLAVNNLGHGHPRVIYALAKQASKLIHVSNVFHTEPQLGLAETLVKNSFADKIFFCNSGAEANEGAVKLARKYAKKHFGPHKFEVITMKNSFHGRTLAMITATGQEKYQKGFEPLMPGFRYAEFGDIESLRATVTDATCAILMEVVQGEGGVRVASPDYYKAVKDLCQEKNLLLIIDEVQTGIGRTGKLFAHQHYGIEPDIMTMAKALASGLPIGAMAAKDFVAETFQPGDHAATFGGNPLVTAVGKATLDVILQKGFLKEVQKNAQYLQKKLNGLKKSCPVIQEVRGLGFMVGIDLSVPAKPLVMKCIEKGLLINAVQEQTLRMLPALIVKKKEIDESIEILQEVLSSL